MAKKTKGKSVKATKIKSPAKNPKEKPLLPSFSDFTKLFIIVGGWTFIAILLYSTLSR